MGQVPGGYVGLNGEQLSLSQYYQNQKAVDVWDAKIWEYSISDL